MYKFFGSCPTDLRITTGCTAASSDRIFKPLTLAQHPTIIPNQVFHPKIETGSSGGCHNALENTLDDLVLFFFGLEVLNSR